MIKVLIVEDSLVVREMIKAILEGSGEFEVIGEAVSGEEAVSFVRKQKPDVITMDVNLHGKDGLEATREIMAENPAPIVIMSTLFNPKDSLHIFKALETGAIGVFSKPHSIGTEIFEKYEKELCRYLKVIAGVKVLKRKSDRSKKIDLRKTTENVQAKLDAATSRIKLIAIGSSTGGPQVLNEILSKIKKDFHIPIVVVQHITSGFTQPLTEWLNLRSSLEIKVAAEGEKLLPGFCYFAPDEHHLTITNKLIVKLNSNAPVHSCRPSISALFDSIAENFKNDVIGIILTGMGSDGSLELKKIFDNGSITIAQNEESCTVFGMPKEAIKAGGSKYIYSPQEIIEFLNALENKNER